MSSHDQVNHSPITTTTFPKFPSLPQELQDKIWLLSLPAPRLIEFRPHLFVNHIPKSKTHPQLPSPYSRKPSTPRKYVLRVSQCLPPALLHVCRQSRFLAKRYYGLSFARELRRPIYFDKKRDMILLTGAWALRYLLERSNTGWVGKSEFLILDPLNLTTRYMEPGRCPDAQESEVVVRMGPLYGLVKHVKVLKPGLTLPASTPSGGLISDPRTSEDDTDIDDRVWVG